MLAPRFLESGKHISRYATLAARILSITNSAFISMWLVAGCWTSYVSPEQPKPIIGKPDKSKPAKTCENLEAFVGGMPAVPDIEAVCHEQMDQDGYWWCAADQWRTAYAALQWKFSAARAGCAP